MKIDTEKKKLYIAFSVTLILSISLCILCMLQIQRSYQKEMYLFCEKVAEKVVSKYPNVETDLISVLTHSSMQKVDTSLLQQYGIEESDLDMHFHTLSFQTKLGLAICFIFIMFFLAMFILLQRYIRRQNKKFQELVGYSEEILQGNYRLDIRDNEEGELSILKNHIYDMTVMLREKSEWLQQDKKEMEKLIADISHQLKTPLTSLTILTDLLYDEKLPIEKRQEFVKSMTKELSKIDWLIKTLLNLAKLDSKTLVLKQDVWNVKDMLIECKEEFSVICELMGIQISVQGEKDITMIGDKKWTKEAINNLIKNASQHHAKHITITLSSNHIYTSIEIQDDGEGIDNQDINHIFERFYRAKNATSGSFGLGLAFVKSIVTYQNGEIKVKSKPKVGTKFTIKFYH